MRDVKNRSYRNAQRGQGRRRTTGRVNRAKTQRQRSVFWVIVLLLGVNIVVFNHYGDPRDTDASWQARQRLKEKRQAEKDMIRAKEGQGDKAQEKVLAFASPAPRSALKKAKALASAMSSSDSAVPASQAKMLQRGEPALVGPDIALAPFQPTLGLRTLQEVQRVETLILGRGQTAAAALAQSGLEGGQINAILNGFSGLVDFRYLRPGHRLKVRYDGQGEVVSVDIIRGRLEQSRASRQSDGSYAGKDLDIPVEKIDSLLQGEVSSSLWGALVQDLGESASLVHDFVDIFAWEIDFYSQVHPGDRFKILVEKRYADGEFVGYGPIKAAHFESAGHTFAAYMHKNDNDIVSYYGPEGESLRKQLLKAPLKYGHVTSRFGKRRHPVLGYTRSHNGTDYGVPQGTPIWSVGDGVVVRAGWAGGFGKLIEIRHANGWLSQYAHLSKIEVKVGQRVVQKQVMGRSGNTGLSSGPHLHYGLKHHGRYVDSLRQNFERGKSLSGAALASFKANTVELRERLESERLEATQVAKAEGFAP